MFLTGGIEYNDNHSLKGTLLQIRKMDDLAGQQTGFLATEATEILSNRLEWIERDLLSANSGEHIFYDFNELTLNWHYNESRAKRESPDFRQSRYEYSHRSTTMPSHLGQLPISAGGPSWKIITRTLGLMQKSSSKHPSTPIHSFLST